MLFPSPSFLRWIKGEETFEVLLLVLAVAFNKKSERWLDVGDAPAMDHAAVDEWVGVLTPDDQASISD
jgi:hypothetical protein